MSDLKRRAGLPLFGGDLGWTKFSRHRSVSQLMFVEGRLDPIASPWFTEARAEREAVELLQRVPSDLLEELEEAFEDASDHDDDDGAEWGPPSTEEAVREAAFKRFRTRLGHRIRSARSSVTADEYATLTGQSVDDVLAMAASGQLVSIAFKQARLFPIWQFTDDWKVRDGAVELLRVFPGGASALTEWMNEPNARWGGISPADMLAADSTAWLDIVRALRSEGPSSL